MKRLARLLCGLMVMTALGNSPAGADPGVPASVGTLSAVHVRSNGLTEATVAAGATPRFGWKLASARPDDRQSAYQIVVDGGAWDSGVVDSDETAGIAYAGQPLRPGQRYTWRVRVWDAEHRPSAWSDACAFFTAPDQWSAQWIGLDDPQFRGLAAARWIWFPEGRPTESAPVGTRYFARSLDLPDGDAVRSARVSVIADDLFELRVNGDVVAAGNTSMRLKAVDVADHLRAGKNRVELSVINQGPTATPAGVIVSAQLDLASGKRIDLQSDGQWQSSIDKKAWPPAMELGRFGIGPWGKIGQGGGRVAARYARREFHLDKPLARATASVCGLGMFDLMVNGHPASDHVMDPALSDYDRGCYYVTFDLTSQLKPGANAVGVVLGNGRFYAPRLNGTTTTYGFPQLRFQLQLDYADGSRELVSSDDRWRITTDGPIRANNEYDGETYDARLEMPGWASPGFDDHAWTAADRVAGPTGTLVPQDVEPMRVTEVLRPVSVTTNADGETMVDFGQNFYGTVRLRATAAAGTTVRLTGAYAVRPDGRLKTADNRSARCTDVYTFAGKGEEVWSPRFVGRGMRHVRVVGLPGRPTADNFEGLVIHTDAEPVGDFACSDDLVNRIHLATRWGARMFLRSAPLDPDRDERQAWMGDPAKDAESEAYNFDVSSFYRKWMDDLGRSQRSDGSLPDVAMYWAGGDGVEWPSVYTIIPDWMADFYGDATAAQVHYESIKQWVLAMRRHERPDGTLKATSFGDWCDTYTIGGKITDFGQTPRDLISSAYQYHNERIVQRMAERFGHPDDQRTFAAMADKLRDDFNRRFLDPVAHTYAGDTQCANLLPLTFGLVPDGQRAAVVDRLVDDILVRHQGHLSVGLIGMQWLMQTLTDVGRPDVAWTIATQTTSPSWGYMIRRGATTIWERWDYETRDPGMNSEALLIQAGNLDAWFYQTLAGIRPAGPAFKRILIRPQPQGDLAWVKAHLDSPSGRIESSWRRDGDRLTMDVTIPVNTTATIVVPGPEGGEHAVGPGHYRYAVRLPTPATRPADR